MKLTDKVDSLRERVLVFGGPKSGKTEIVGRLAEQFNLHYFDLENGYKTLRKLPVDWQERINLYSIPDTKIWPIAIETMLKVVTGLPVTFCVEHGRVGCQSCKKVGAPVETVELNALGPNDIAAFDSGTQLALSCMSHIKRNDDELDKPTWDNYASQGFLMDKFLSQVQQAKYNLCAITHEVESELENGGKKLVPVFGTREFSRNSAKYFDHVVYCELKNKKHAFGSATDYALSVLTGSRSAVAIEKLDKPSLLPFFRHEIPKTDAARTVAAVMSTGLDSNIKVAEAAFSKDVDTTTDNVMALPEKPAEAKSQESMADRMARIRKAREAAEVAK